MRITKHDGTWGEFAIALCGDSCEVFYIFIYKCTGMLWEAVLF